MKSLSIQAIDIFNQLIKKSGTKQCSKFLSEGYMPLTFELIGKVNTHFGKAETYSMSHYFIQDGDLMRDPEMCFMVMPVNAGQHVAVQIFPYSFRLDSFGVDEESIEFLTDGALHVKLNLQQQHTAFANDWLNNIQEQGFLK